MAEFSEREQRPISDGHKIVEAQAREVVREWVTGLDYGHLPPGKITDLTNRIAAAFQPRSSAAYEEGIRACVEKVEELRATWERGDGLNQLSTRTVGQIRGATKIINALVSLSATTKETNNADN